VGEGDFSSWGGEPKGLSPGGVEGGSGSGAAARPLLPLSTAGLAPLPGVRADFVWAAAELLAYVVEEDRREWGRMGLVM